MINTPVNNQKGYIDLQTPLIIIGVILIVGLVHYLAITETLSFLSYLAVAIIFAVFGFAFYVNIDSLKCPESPFNKHTSPYFIACCVIASLGYGIWKLYNGPHTVFIYIFCIGITITVIYAILSAFLRN